MLRHVFFVAPHRVMFTAGVVQILLALAAWTLELLLRAAGAGATLLPGLPATWWHMALMVFGFFPFLTFGFLMTALPKWVGAGPLAQRDFLPAFFLMSGGWLWCYVAAAASLWLPPGLWLVAGGWLLGARSLLAAAAGADNPDKRHAYLAILATVFGALALAGMGIALAAGSGAGMRAAAMLGLWAYLVPVFVTVMHRMLPFFSQSAMPQTPPYKPMWLLWTLLAACLGHGLASALGRTAWAAPFDALAAALALHLSWRWNLRGSFKVPLLATHHLAFLWLGVAFALFALQGLLAWLGIDWGGVAPLHALTVGFMLSLVFGMATRVTLGHSGCQIVAPPWLWPAFLGLQALALLRLAAEFVPAALAPGLLAVAGGGLCVVFGVWAARYLRLFVRPRADGQPG